MPLSIRNAEVENLAREVSRLTGESVTEAIGKSLESRLDMLRRHQRQDAVRKEIDEILARVHALPILDDRPEDEILGYDENGIPR